MKTAVVMGAGIGGLLATRVLSEFADRVLLVDRDFLDLKGPRRGVAQASQLHVLLQRGRLTIEELFPGVDQELAYSGAPEIDWAMDTAWLSRYGWFPRHESSVKTRSYSRSLLERTLRQRVLALPNVDAVERFEVESLSFDASGSRVSAVRGPAGDLSGDLFVEATGRGKHSFSSQPWQSIDAHVGYASCVLELPKGLLAPFAQVYIQMRPPQHVRGGVLIPIEDGLHLLTLVGGAKDYPPAQRAAFLEFARSLHDRALFDVLSAAKQVAPIVCYRKTSGYRRRRSRGRPVNLLSLGDSHCAFNPVYGQGMTVVALSALKLRKQLRAGVGLNRVDLRGPTRLPWLMATSEDLRVRSAAIGGFGLRTRLGLAAFRTLTDFVTKRAVKHPAMHERFLKILHMMS